MKDKILEICVFEDNTIKLTVNGQQRHCSRIEFIAEIGEAPRLITNEFVCKLIEPEAVYVDDKELKPPKTADKSWLEAPKRKRGRPRKNTIFNVGDKVKIKTLARLGKKEYQFGNCSAIDGLIGKVVTIDKVGLHGLEDCYTVKHPEWGNVSFGSSELELVKKGDKK